MSTEIGDSQSLVCYLNNKINEEEGIFKFFTFLINRRKILFGCASSSRSMNNKFLLER